MGILHLGERQRLRLFARADPFGRFFSMLVFVPRDRFNTENRRRIEAILRTATGASSIDYTTRVSESVLVRLHFVAYVEAGAAPDFDAGEVEMMLVAATRSWADDLEEALVEELGEAQGGELFQRYGDAFPAAYRADWVARSALADIVHIEELPDADGLGISLYRPLEAGPRMLRAKLFRAGRPLMLSDVLPLRLLSTALPSVRRGLSHRAVSIEHRPRGPQQSRKRGRGTRPVAHEPENYMLMLQGWRA